MRLFKYCLTILALMTLVACGGGNSGTSSTPASPTNPTTAVTYSLNVNITGLVGAVVLQNNGADNLTINLNGSASFTTQVASGANYAISILIQPSGSNCILGNSSGTVTGSNITNISVICTVNASGGGNDDSGGRCIRGHGASM